jgi:hypothetical protein
MTDAFGTSDVFLQVARVAYKYINHETVRLSTRHKSSLKEIEKAINRY